MNNLAVKLKRAYHRGIGGLIGMILTPEVLKDSHNFALWEKRGYHITPNHIYQPIPDTRQLEKNYPKISFSRGIDYREDFQLSFLQGTITTYSREFNNFPLIQKESNSFYLHNDGFCGIDPHVYYSIIRHFKPDRIIEVGSGHSTFLGYQALQRNNSNSELIFIDPWPKDRIQSFIRENPPGIRHKACKVEELDIDYFSSFKENDILFIDSSHTVRTGGDICFLILDILPSLPKGVLIHFHDIYLPSDYPKEIILGQHMFWTEQYLLQAYMIENDHIEVLFSSHYLSKKHKEVIRKTFPNAIWWTGESFWIRKCK